MIKLVSQFDNENSKLSLATPTCGACCCCCCCCIITTIVTASISGRNFGRYLAKLDKEKTKQKYIVPKIILRFIGYFVYVLASLIAMFCLLDNGFNDTTTKLDFFNYNIELTSGDYLTFVLILVVISIILIKQNKNKNINNEQSITKIDGTGSVSKKLKISGIFNLLIIILIVLSLFLLGVDGLWIILFIGLIGGYYVLMKLEKFIKKDIKKDDDKDIGGK